MMKRRMALVCLCLLLALSTTTLSARMLAGSGTRVLHPDSLILSAFGAIYQWAGHSFDTVATAIQRIGADGVLSEPPGNDDPPTTNGVLSEPPGVQEPPPPTP
jgi:hypothetical protein